MKITVLGSGGGEAYPATFCGCEHCNEARRVGGKSIRTLSQTLINDDLLIDYPSDTAEHARRYGLNLGDVGNILITHTHTDHFAPAELLLRGVYYAHNMRCPELNLYGSSDVRRVFNGIKSLYSCHPEIEKSISTSICEPYGKYAIGSYTVTALPARHNKRLECLNYIITDGKSTLIYFHDTGLPDEEIMAYLENEGIRADCVMMDATMGVAEVSDHGGHMSFEQNKRLAATLRERRIADAHTLLVANHITHNHAKTHENIEQIFEGTGIVVAYDGMVIDI